MAQVAVAATPAQVLTVLRVARVETAEQRRATHTTAQQRTIQVVGAVVQQRQAVRLALVVGMVVRLVVLVLTQPQIVAVAAVAVLTATAAATAAQVVSSLDTSPQTQQVYR